MAQHTTQVVVTVGVAIASYGEINFNITGVMFQMASIVSESTRLVMVQLLLQSRGLKLNPVTTLYYVAPCCFAFLLLPFIFLEGPKLMADPNLSINPLIFLANALVAFGEAQRSGRRPQGSGGLRQRSENALLRGRGRAAACPERRRGKLDTQH